MERDSGRSALYHIARALSGAVDMLALLLFMLLLLYAGYSLWYTHSLQHNSFLSDELAQYRPDGRTPALSELRKINPDVTAWLRIDNTNIDYPVVRGEDDSEYLNKTVLGEFSLSGSLFMSAENSADFSDRYNIVYGHNVEGGAMLADVLEFRDASFFRKHTGGTLWYPDMNGKARADRVEIFAAAEVLGTDETVYSDPHKVRGNALRQLVGYAMKCSRQKRNIRLEKDDRIIALSTCENAQDLDRVVLFGRLKPMSDDEVKAMLEQMKEESSGALGGRNDGERTGAPVLLLVIALLLLVILILLLYLIVKGKEPGDHSPVS